MRPPLDRNWMSVGPARRVGQAAHEIPFKIHRSILVRRDHRCRAHRQESYCGSSLGFLRWRRWAPAHSRRISHGDGSSVDEKRGPIGELAPQQTGTPPRQEVKPSPCNSQVLKGLLLRSNITRTRTRRPCVAARHSGSIWFCRVRCVPVGDRSPIRMRSDLESEDYASGARSSVG